MKLFKAMILLGAVVSIAVVAFLLLISAAFAKHTYYRRNARQVQLTLT